MFIIYFLDGERVGVGQILLLYVVLNTDFFCLGGGGGGDEGLFVWTLTLLIIFFERRVGYSGVT